LKLAAAASRRRRLVSALEVRVAMSDFVSESSIAALDRSRSKLIVKHVNGERKLS
jgi:hypothetical protein